MDRPMASKALPLLPPQLPGVRKVVCPLERVEAPQPWELGWVGIGVMDLGLRRRSWIWGSRQASCLQLPHPMPSYPPKPSRAL